MYESCETLIRVGVVLEQFLLETAILQDFSPTIQKHLRTLNDAAQLVIHLIDATDGAHHEFPDRLLLLLSTNVPKQLVIGLAFEMHALPLYVSLLLFFSFSLSPARFRHPQREVEKNRFACG